MKIKTVVFAGLLAASGYAAAQDTQSSHYKAAQAVMEATDSVSMLRQARTQMDKMLEARMRQLETKIPSDKLDEFEEYKRNVSGLMRKNLRWNDLQKEFTQVYMDIYSEAELKELADFFRSSVGRKFVDKVPELTQRSAGIMQRRMAKIVPQIQELTNELQQEVKASGE